MFLKSLILKGFKSFADTTRIDFEHGVTVVVGPNGSGKSNLVDAIAWVLGSQSPRSVRSAKMEDVIFAGSQKRTALGRAEVSLVLDNESGLIPLDFPEIVISRTLFRTGESEYGINDAPCRLMDVADLLSEGGMGQRQHTIVSQGEVETVLNDRSEDRRMIIEEAAGVLKHRKRRERAERRLASTDSDLARLGDLLREVSRQLEPLERQATAARQHQEMLEHLNELRIYVAGEELKGLKQEKDYLGQKHKTLKAKELELIDNEASLNKEITSEEAKLKEFGMDSSGETLASLESLKARTEAALKNLKEQALRLDANKKISHNIEETRNLEAECRADLDNVLAEKSKLKLSQSELESKLEKAKYLEKEIAELKAQISVQEVIQADTTSNELKQQLEDLTNQYQDISSLVEQQEVEVNAKESEKIRWTSQLKALSMTQDFISLQENLAGVEILGDLVEAAPGYERAAAAALGEVAQGILASDREQASQILGELKEKGIAGMVLLANNNARTTTGGKNEMDSANPNHKFSDALLRNKVSVKKSSFSGSSNLNGSNSNEADPTLDLESILNSLIGEVLVASSWEAAIELHLETGSVVVTTDGDRFSLDGWQLGNLNSQVETDLTTAARKAAEAEAKANLSELEGYLLPMSMKLKELKSKEQNILVAKKSLESQIQAGDERARLAKVTQQDLETQLEKVEKDYGRDLRHSLEELQRLKAQIEFLLDRQRALEISLASHTQKLSMLEEQLVQEAVQGFDKLGVITNLNIFFSAVLSEVESRLMSLREDRRIETEASRASAQKLDINRAGKAEVDAELAELRDAIYQTDIAFAEVSAHLENAVQNLERDLECSVADAVASKCPEIPGNIPPKERIQDIEHELRLIGPINHLALQEYENIKNRHGFLAEQVEDIKSARKDLRKLIRTIDVEMANAFESAFLDIAQNFEKLFQIVFPGGEGSLTLSNSDNLLETGVDIHARPGEKRIKRLSLLSGGERSLVALTFLFAVLKSRPAPFCILDEVDAALDDVNLCRFLDLVQVLTDDTQLLIVSHQKLTMESADFLYGISMPTEGVTKVISEKKNISVS